MSFWSKNSGLGWFCIIAFVGTVGVSALVAATPPGEPVPESEKKTNVRRGGNSVLFVHSRRRYHRRSSIFGSGSRSSSSSSSSGIGRSSSRRGSVGSRSHRGGGLFGGK